MGETENQNIVVVGGRGRAEVDQEAIIVAGTPVGTANLNTVGRSTRKIQWEEEMKTVKDKVKLLQEHNETMGLKIIRLESGREE